MKIFAVSDVHGFYDELKACLDEAGYDRENLDHLLVDCGDFFDRGEQALEIYKYYKSLTDNGEAVILRGNHTSMLIDFLKGEDCSFNFAHNGLNKTIDSFLGDTNSWHTFLVYLHELKDNAKKVYKGYIEEILENPEAVPNEIIFDAYQRYARDKINEEYPELLSWLESLPYYFETKNYIFTHASIDGECEDWHNPTFTPYSFWTPWEYLTWDDGGFYKKKITNTNKTVVVGHFYTDRLRKMYGLEYDDEMRNPILKSPDSKKIFIDTCTPVSLKVNVFITEDELLDS